jgi:hypothetical protein
LPQSKASKLETARQTPNDDDIRAWTRATGNESHTDGLLTALHTLEAQHAEWQRVLGFAAPERAHEHLAMSERWTCHRQSAAENSFGPNSPYRKPERATSGYRNRHRNSSQLWETPVTPMRNKQLMQRVLDGLHRLDSTVLRDGRCPS